MTLTFINNPQLAFRVQQVGSMVQIKPFAGYYIWLDWFDLAPLDFGPAIDILTGLISDVNDIALAALTDAATAAAAASTAQAAADAAQATADAALATAGAAAAYPKRFSVMWDEAELVTGTKAKSRVAGMDYGYACHAGGLINNEMKMSFVCDLSAGGTVTILCVTNNGAGIIQPFVNGIPYAGIDLYTAVQALNVEKTFSIISGDFGAGLHIISLKGSSKHASSSGYFLVVTKIWFTDGSD